MKSLPLFWADSAAWALFPMTPYVWNVTVRNVTGEWICQEETGVHRLQSS
jgi:hypothetical protein